MGRIVIRTTGSFGDHQASFTALDGGHAHAIARTIEHLSGVFLPEAIYLDHKLHDKGVRPPHGDFGYAKEVTERDRLQLLCSTLLSALQRAEHKLAAYVGVCSDDTELVNTVIPMARDAIAAAEVSA